MHGDLLELVPAELHAHSGGVLYSGRSAFRGPRPLYLLGLNPGGDPAAQGDETIGRSICIARTRSQSEGSAYADESWQDRAPGTATLQPRVLHLLRSLNLEPRSVPASNVVFVRSKREGLLMRKAELLRDCWPLHEAVIRGLRVRVIACMGATAGAWTREMVGAHELVESWSEQNDRRWTSRTHIGRDGLQVVTLAHPSIAAWNTAAADPSHLVLSALGRS